MNSCLPLPAHPWTAAAGTHKLFLTALFSPWHGDMYPEEELALSTQFLHTIIFFFWQPADWEVGPSSVSYGSSLVLLWEWVTVTSCHFSVQSKILIICTGGSYHTASHKSWQGISPEFPYGKETERIRYIQASSELLNKTYSVNIQSYF